MRTFHFLFSALLLMGSTALFSQDTINLQMPTSINLDGAPPDGSAMLDVQSTTKGMLVPRLTTAQRTAIATPATGLLVYDTTTGGFWFYNGTAWADLSTSKTLADADDNTKIQVEENPNEDIIRFDFGGMEHYVMDGPRLEVKNSGRSVFIGDGAGANDDLSNNQNVAVGDSALFSNTTGGSNTANGLSALYSNTTGSSNTANGLFALYSNTMGSINTAYGLQAMYLNTTGNDNTAYGVNALYSNKANNRSTAIGRNAMYYADNRTTGQDTYNTAVGYEALRGSTTAANNTGRYNTAVGDQALFSNTTGSFNTAIGRSADVLSPDLSKATAIGYNAKVNCSNCFVLGGTGADAVKVGIGTETPDALLDLEDGALLAQGTVGGTPISGAGTRLMWIPEKSAFRAGQVTANQWNDGNIGSNSFVGGGTNNTASNSNSFVGGGTNNTASNFHSFAGGGTNNTASAQSSFAGGGNNNTASGSNSFVGGGFSNTASGFQSFAGGGGSNVALGFNSFAGGGAVNEASGSNSFVGGGESNGASGDLSFVGGGEDNTASGNGSFVGGGFSNMASNNYSFVGGGNSNVSSGTYSFISGGISNTASGAYTFVGGGQSLTAKSGFETVFGIFNTDYTPISTNNFNAADRLFVIGNGTSTSARSNAVTVMKNGNVGIGTETPDAILHTKITAANNASLPARTGLFLDNDAQDGTFPNNPNSVALAFGENGSAKQAIVGATFANDYLRFYIGSNFTTAKMTLDNTGLGIGRTPATNQLEVNGNASKTTAGDWLANSDARLKKNIRPLDSEEILQKMLALRGITYEWDDDRTGSERPEGTMYGFTAQNIQEVFPELVNEDNLGFLQTAYGTYDAMTVEAIRALNDKVENLEAENAELKSQLSEMDEMKSELSAIRAALDQAGIAPE